MKKGKSQYSAAAKEDVKKLSEYLTAQIGNRQPAMRIIRELLETAEKLGRDSPRVRIGQKAEHLGSEIRLLNHKRWIIVFRYTTSGADILRIVDGSQDYMNWKL